MSEPYRKKLIEVALPLEAINRESAREKSIRHGHPSTLHLWWARRPLAACRAVLFASIIDDPSSRPDLFPTEEEQEAERQRLFGLIEELVKWENSDNERVLTAARAEILKATNGNPPPVLDPFCGGGSIPLEAQRLGLEARASDLNPVAVLITKALIEIPPKFAGRPPVNPESREKLGYDSTWNGAQGLAEDVRYYGKWMRDQAFERIGHLYPKAKLRDGSESTVIAWLWTRTVTCPNPACGGRMPLARSFALSTKQGKEAFAEPVVDREAKTVRFEVRQGTGAPPGTVNRRGATCVLCGAGVPLDHVRAEGKAGRIGTQLMAIVTDAGRGRTYVGPDPEHEEIAASAAPTWAPDSDLPEAALGFRVQGYGITKHRDLFTPRQLVALTTFSDLVQEARIRVADDTDNEQYADAVATYLALGTSRLADNSSSLVVWSQGRDQLVHTFGRQTLSMVWDFAEGNAFSNSAGDLGVAIKSIARSLESLPAAGPAGISKQLDAMSAVNGVASALVSTDPPYYDNIGYAHLADFFYVWLRRSLNHIYPDLFSTLLTPKSQELIADPHRSGGKRQAEAFFEQGSAEAFQQMRQIEHPGFPSTVFYAFKQTESDRDGGAVASTGWETMLEGLLRAGHSITGTWPMRTERSSRLRDLGSNALASSIVLVCRPRAVEAVLATRRDFIAALKAELPDALRKLQHGNIAPVDLAQAAIGPGIAIFSRYAKVIEADGSAMTVRTALGLINQALDEILAEQEGDFDSDTRFAIAWFEQHGMSEGPFGEADVLARAKDSAVGGLEDAGVLLAKAGKVRLLSRDELEPDWDPTIDRRLTVWEVAQHLTKQLADGGEDAAADLLQQVGGLGEVARELAYRLYTICERKGWAPEALGYNALVVSWPEIARLAAEQATGSAQQSLGV
jgi:putative DNA methylase